MYSTIRNGRAISRKLTASADMINLCLTIY